MPLDDELNSILKEPNPQADAVKSLIEVKRRGKGDDSDIEIKTDLSINEVNIHTVVDLMNSVIEMDSKTFASKCILGELINKRERKLLSKDRKSRLEIVEIARHPDTTNIMGIPSQQQNSPVGRFFRPHK